MSSSIFKAYDIRGKYPDEINEKVVSEIVAALAKHFKSGVIVVGRDARLSSPVLYKAVIKAFSVERLAFSKKNKKSKTLYPKPYTLITVGLTTTPMFYFLVNYFKAIGGIMITASHNPKEYNGLKVVGKKAVPMSGEDVYKLITNN